MNWTESKLKEKFNTYKQRFMKMYPGSDTPKFLFNDDGTFTTNNWNGNDILRHYVMSVYEETNKNDDVIVIFKNDNWYAIINVEYDHTVFMKWYKSRGRTENIVFDDHPITISEYVKVLNALDIDESYSFK